MAIHFDLDNETPQLETEVDPFLIKAQKAEEHRESLLETFFLFPNAQCEVEDTTLIELFLTQSITFDDNEMMSILCLQPSNLQHRQLYASLLLTVRYAASVLKRNKSELAQMPMSDIRRICYRIADRYGSVFFELKKGEFPVVGDKYNSMWPIVSMLNREYASRV